MDEQGILALFPFYFFVNSVVQVFNGCRGKRLIGHGTRKRGRPQTGHSVRVAMLELIRTQMWIAERFNLKGTLQLFFVQLVLFRIIRCEPWRD